MKTWHGVGLVLVALLGVVEWGGAMETNALPLRIWSVSRDSMDYVFMSSTPGVDGSPILSFNHRNGRTSFLRVGDRLGDWLVAGHAPGKREERNPRSGQVKEVDADVVTLEGEDRVARRLDQGKLFTIDGYRTLLMDLKSGRRHDVRGGDVVEADGGVWSVANVSPSSVTLKADGREHVIPLISDAEVASLRQRAADLAAAERREAERVSKVEERRKAEAWTENVKIPPREVPTQQKTFRDTEPCHFFGTYGPVPVEYTIVPPLFDSNGRMIRSAIAVPTRFETRPVSGFGNCPATRRQGISVQIGR